ncbi:MAG TPA: chlorophyll synthesis pathway protein BchC [Methylibium sp.]|uniref:chlorophyll synthesis pathway protein BchC n=1 Tax=Methylibium sp. TaxID=2067992 RepID=UPI002DBC9F7B|nr:chlorophyll synthesis pathway protein BchC [Methylibium sp.]HEU4457699.1 chlorophyll synthesis pathway protein BchC [Methylibium sp.]
MHAQAVVFEQPGQLALSRLDLTVPSPADVVVAIDYSGISTGTERLLWNGQMPVFPGMGYPLVPGYESVGYVVEAGPDAKLAIGERVFVPGARCFGDVRGLFGGAASQLVVPAARVVPIAERLGANAVLLALAATAYHAVAGGGKLATIEPPELIVGHGVLGRLLARLTVAAGLPAPTVWELDERRSAGAHGYTVLRPDDDPRRDYRTVYDVSGDSALLDRLIQRVAPGGEIVLAGFYQQRLGFDFAPAFMKEVRLRVAAEWQRADMTAVTTLLADGRLSLDGLITHTEAAEHADGAYRCAFGDAACLKMVLDWRACA